MGKGLKAVQAGTGHFFSFGGTKTVLRDARDGLRKPEYGVVKKGGVMGILALNMAKRTTPLYWSKNTLESMQVGRARYQQLKQIHQAAPVFLQQTGLSGPGQQTILNAMNNPAADGDARLNLSPADQNILDDIAGDLFMNYGYIAPRAGTANF